METSAAKVGDREYCLKSVLCRFEKLGFNNTFISKTIKKLSKSFLECFFFVSTLFEIGLVKTYVYFTKRQCAKFA